MFDGKALQRIREAHGLKPSELADRAGVSRQTVWSYEAGLSEPRVGNWLSICRVLEIGFDDLYVHDEDATPPIAAGAETTNGSPAAAAKRPSRAPAHQGG